MAETKIQNCHKCGGEIRTCVYFGIELESCENCGGFFLDPKLIKKIPALARSDAETLQKRQDQSGLDQATMICPKCQCYMSKRIQRRRKIVVLDVCPSCHGIWFDAGEYAKCCGLDVKERAEKQEMYKVHLYCDVCDISLWKPKKEQNVCQRCGSRLSLALAADAKPPFWYNNHGCSAFLLVAGTGIIYFSALKSLGSAFQALALTLLGFIPWLYAVRAFIYRKFFGRNIIEKMPRDFDLD